MPTIKLSLLRELILAGYDPLGEVLCALRSSELRRGSSATYTPGPVVPTMVDWAETRHKPAGIVDPGTALRASS